ncbi:6-bladed beta-propeller [Maribellus maritimus]|uniref:6-bladed beta-propeller n=1 Tax=Maribellus maritimus TaxID=2870838 RepID=UPI001EEC074B|nr:6-bladed beta-propeller [Maribellus maritimus]MCG6189348.1 6-bladed beta-propeller [Maribellus maritimus]
MNNSNLSSGISFIGNTISLKIVLFISVILISYLSLSLRATTASKKADNVEIIDLKMAFQNMQRLQFDELFRGVKYVMLETGKSCMIDNGFRFFADDSVILLNGNRQIFLFDKSSGKFIKKIGNIDKSPKGYKVTLGGLPFDEKNKIIYAENWNKSWCGYNFQGEKVCNIKFPTSFIGSFGILNDSTFAGFLLNILGNEKRKIVTFRTSGNIVQTFPNPFSFVKKSPSISVSKTEGLFCRYNNNLFFKEAFNDTLFYVEEKSLTPRYVFQMGKYSFPYEKKDELEDYKQDKNGNLILPIFDYFVISNLCESERFLFFEFLYNQEKYWGYYNKKTKVTKIVENKALNITRQEGVPFQLLKAYINSDNEIITYIEAYKLVEWMTNNPEKAKNVPAVLKAVKETDNPVVMIAKLKE